MIGRNQPPLLLMAPNALQLASVLDKLKLIAIRIRESGEPTSPMLPFGQARELHAHRSEPLLCSPDILNRERQACESTDESLIFYQCVRPDLFNNEFGGASIKCAVVDGLYNVSWYGSVRAGHRVQRSAGQHFLCGT